LVCSVSEKIIQKLLGLSQFHESGVEKKFTQLDVGDNLNLGTGGISKTM